MTTSVQEILSNFDSLSEPERLEIVLEILKRVTHLEFLPLSDDDLVWNAEEIFLELDKQESAYE
ncbi:MAG: hypothetical protein RMY28_004135 [Nostoc sp. ChiSLP01]|nr:hypothetical protein [Nostoc sp. CmiSLP01]MDZ8286259.1 hypothetical protein [Nostoc sp. ChiSLP01]